MKLVEPKIYLIAETRLDRKEVYKFLYDIGCSNFDLPDNDTIALSEIAGRICYMSFDPKLNDNLKKIRTDSNKYIRNIIDNGHHSILEHCTMTFLFKDVSRVFTHELVRHRVGVAYSQTSGRYVRSHELRVTNFDRLNLMSPEFKNRILDILKKIEELYNDFGVKISFGAARMAVKKYLTSILRRFLPQGQSTNIVFTTNHRALRHILQMRTGSHAEEEIHYIFSEVMSLVKNKYSVIYEDIK